MRNVYSSSEKNVINANLWHFRALFKNQTKHTTFPFVFIVYERERAPRARPIQVLFDYASLFVAY